MVTKTSPIFFSLTLLVIGFFSFSHFSFANQAGSDFEERLGEDERPLESRIERKLHLLEPEYSVFSESPYDHLSSRLEAERPEEPSREGKYILVPSRQIQEMDVDEPVRRYPRIVGIFEGDILFDPADYPNGPDMKAPDPRNPEAGGGGFEEEGATLEERWQAEERRHVTRIAEIERSRVSEQERAGLIQEEQRRHEERLGQLEEQSRRGGRVGGREPGEEPIYRPGEEPREEHGSVEERRREEDRIHETHMREIEGAEVNDQERKRMIQEEQRRHEERLGQLEEQSRRGSRVGGGEPGEEPIYRPGEEPRQAEERRHVTRIAEIERSDTSEEERAGLIQEEQRRHEERLRQLEEQSRRGEDDRGNPEEEGRRIEPRFGEMAGEPATHHPGEEGPGSIERLIQEEQRRHEERMADIEHQEASEQERAHLFEEERQRHEEQMRLIETGFHGPEGPGTGEQPTSEENLPISAGVSDWQKLWPKRDVPYTMGKWAKYWDEGDIKKAMGFWAKAGFKFRPKTPEDNNRYVYFMKTTNIASGSSDGIGMDPNGGPRTIKIGYHCGPGLIAHEIGHAIGLFHEQSRSDRDKFVDIFWDNISMTVNPRNF